MKVREFEEIIRKLIENGFSDEAVTRLMHEFIMLNIDGSELREEYENDNQ